MKIPAPNSPEWKRIAPYLDRALELAAHERETWLAELTTTQPDIAASVRDLLVQRDRLDAEGFLSDSPGASLARADVARDEVASRAGMRVGAYVIDRLLGSGGMGDVWLASRSDGRFEGRCAIKFLTASIASSKLADRFRREGYVLARLAHPNIARLLDAGATDDGAPYLAIEFIDGQRIDRCCDSHALSIDARVRLFLSVVAAVAHAHSQLIIHRDLKPSNVLVTHDGQVKLLDFGIAKLMSAHDDGRADGEPTRMEDVMLTPEFSAPEQLLGEQPSTATDVYQLGLLLYVLLVGKHPFPQKMSRAERLRAALDGEVPLASAVAERAASKQLRGDLDAILAKALRKTPADRYVTAQAFQEELERFLRREPVQARKGATFYRAQKFVGRHRVAVSVLSVALVGLCAALGFALLQMRDAQTQRDLAVVQTKRAEAQNELNEFLLSDSAADASPEAQRARLQRAKEMIQSRFRNEPRQQAGLLMKLSGRYVDLGNYEGSAAVMQEAEAIAQRLNDAHLSADIACARSYDAFHIGDLVMARQQEALGRSHMARLAEIPGGLQAECAMTTTLIAQADGDFKRSIDVLIDAMRTLERDGLQQSGRYTSVGNELMRAQFAASDYRGAWKTVSAMLEIVVKTGRTDSSAYYVMVNNGANALARGGQPGEALKLIDSTLANVTTLNPSAELPYFFLATREIAKSMQMGAPSNNARLLKLAETGEQQGARQIALAFRVAAFNAELDRGDVSAAAACWLLLQKSESDLIAKGAEQYRDLARIHLARARFDLMQHDIKEATRRVEAAVVLLTPNGQAFETQLRLISMLRGEIAFASNDYAAAALLAQKAIDRARFEAIDAESSSFVGEALLLRARSEAALGKGTLASASAREALGHLEKNLDSQHSLITLARSITKQSAMESSFISSSPLERTHAVRERISQTRASAAASAAHCPSRNLCWVGTRSTARAA